MRIAYTMMAGKGDMDQLLAGLADHVQAQGARVCGVVQINTECGDGPCDMDVRILPEGPMVRISQTLGPGSRGCRLDPAALEQAAGLVEAALSDAPDLLIINKFGKHEADGRGFRSAIADALGRGIPVLVGLNGMNRDAFDTFTGGQAVALDPTVEALQAWVQASMAPAG
ncbi:MAG: DUF2478 domain-containing protein [Marinibacterium sp.]|nr:DUF2478 domain-containing protein [Marinibacterium sp.]